MTREEYERIIETIDILFVDKYTMLHKLHEGEHYEAMGVVLDGFEDSIKLLSSMMGKMVEQPLLVPDADVVEVKKEVVKETQDVATDDEDDVE